MPAGLLALRAHKKKETRAEPESPARLGAGKDAGDLATCKITDRAPDLNGKAFSVGASAAMDRFEKVGSGLSDGTIQKVGSGSVGRGMVAIGGRDLDDHVALSGIVGLEVPHPAAW